MSLQELRREREERISELEARLRESPRPPVRLSLALLLCIGSAVLLALQWPELSYFLSPSQPFPLGREGEYARNFPSDNRYVEVHGTPTAKGFFWQEGENVLVLVGLAGSPFLLQRGALPTEEWAPGQTPPPPDKRPFTVRGRLLSRASAPRLAMGFAGFEKNAEMAPREGQLWVIFEGKKPRQDVGGFLVGLGLLGLFAANAAWLLKGLYPLIRRRRRQSPGDGERGPSGEKSEQTTSQR
jgi:hypothetical protein